MYKRFRYINPGFSLYVPRNLVLHILRNDNIQTNRKDHEWRLGRADSGTRLAFEPSPDQDGHLEEPYKIRCNSYDLLVEKTSKHVVDNVHINALKHNPKPQFQILF